MNVLDDNTAAPPELTASNGTINMNIGGGFPPVPIYDATNSVPGPSNTFLESVMVQIMDMAAPALHATKDAQDAIACDRYLIAAAHAKGKIKEALLKRVKDILEVK